MIILALAMSLSFAGHVFAALGTVRQDNDVSGRIDEIFEGYLQKTGAKDLQELVWYYADNCGKGEEWIIISLRQQHPGELDFSEYRQAYEKYAPTIGEKSHTARLKAALTLQALGSSSAFIDKAAAEATGQAGIMSWIYGLHVINNGAKADPHTAQSVIDELLSLQFEDGGWAVMGDNGDVDVTAMTIQALAPHCGQEKVKAAVDKAVELLSQKQKENGYFASFGDENAESTAQVLVALSSLELECAYDARFIKGGLNILDILDSFKVAPGGYAHTVGTARNESATVQTLYSLISYDMMHKGKGLLYVFGEFTEPHVERPEKPSDGGEKDPDGGKEDGKDPDKQGGSKNIKPLLYGITAAAAVVACIILLLLKKRSYKSYLFVLILAAVAAAGITFINIADPSDYYGGEDVIADPVKTEIYISAATVAGKAQHIPADGIVLQRTEIVINKGQNALDQLIAAVRKNSIQIENRGGYIAGIANIYEMDHGDLSGWMFRVNGEFSSVNANEYVLSEGDFVEWLYTTDLGRDIGNEYNGK